MKSKLYLATVTVKATQYMVENAREFTATHIVHADSPEAAHVKVAQYYDDKTVPYSVYYRISDMEITEEIS